MQSSLVQGKHLNRYNYFLNKESTFLHETVVHFPHLAYGQIVKDEILNTLETELIRQRFSLKSRGTGCVYSTQ